MKHLALALGWAVAVLLPLAAEEKADKPTAKLVGEWKSGLNTLSIRPDGTAVGAIDRVRKLPGGKEEHRMSAGAFRFDVDGDSVTVGLGAWLDASKWKLSLSADQRTLTMEMVEGKEKEAKIVFGRDAAKEVALAKAREGHRQRAAKALGDKADGHFVYALETMTGGGATAVTVARTEGRAAAVDEIVDFLTWPESNARRSFQMIARFEADDRGAGLARKHHDNLKGLIADRLKRAALNRDAVTSDLEPRSDRTLAQRLADGTCVRYYPLR